MDIFSKDELRTLVEAQTVGCVSVSLYMPTYRAGRTDFQQNPIRLKKLLREAHERLERIGLKRTEANAYLKSAESLLEDSFFWANMSDGLAIFLSMDYFHYYRLPIQLPELVITANRFHIKPLLPMLALDGRFYVLAISQKTVRLLQCTRFGFDELDIAGKIPRSMAEALRFEDADRTAQYHHHYGKGITNLDSKIISAHGDEVEETKENLQRFFLQVDRSLKREILHNETAPLVLIGVDYLFPIYKKANTYDFLLDKEVEGSPDRMSPMELHQHAVSLVEPYFKKRQEDALRLYRESAGLGRTTNDLEKIVSGSYHGKIYILFVAGNRQQWGNYDPFADKVTVSTKEESCDVDLLDFAAAHTLAHRGDIYAVEADKVPDGGMAAAVLRY